MVVTANTPLATREASDAKRSGDAFCSQRWQLRPLSTSCTRSRWRQLVIAGAISWYAPVCALTRRDFVRELRAVSGESLIRVHSIGPYHRLLAVGDTK